MSGVSPYATVRSAVYGLVDDDLFDLEFTDVAHVERLLGAAQGEADVELPRQSVWSVSTVRAPCPSVVGWNRWALGATSRIAGRRGEQHRRDDEEGDDPPFSKGKRFLGGRARDPPPGGGQGEVERDHPRAFPGGHPVPSRRAPRPSRMGRSAGARKSF